MPFDAKELSKEVGVGKVRLPIGLWLVSIAIGVYLARNHSSLLHLPGSSSSTSSATGAGTASATDPLAVPSSLPSTSTLGLGGAVNVPGGAFNSPAASAITTNDQWRVAATQYLIAQQYNALTASNAVAKYLDGDQLNAAETHMIEVALRAIGPTPEPVIPPIGLGTTPTPSPSPAPKPGPIVVPIQQATPSVRILSPKFGIAGEKFVSFANTQDGRGTWWLTNKGGVWAAGTARFHGAPGGSGARIVTRWPIDGYTTIDANGKQKSFP